MSADPFRSADALDQWWDAYQRGEITDGIPLDDMNLIQEISAMHAHAISSADEQRVWRRTTDQIKLHRDDGGFVHRLLNLELPQVFGWPTSLRMPRVFSIISIVAVVAIVSLIFSQLNGNDERPIIFAPGNATPPAITSDVPMYRGNLERTGEMPGPGPVEVPAVIWEATLGGSITHGPILADGVIYIDDSGGNIHALDARTGDVRWQISTGAGGASTLVAGDGLIYATAYDGSLRALSTNTGEEVWRDDRATVKSPAVVVGTQVVFHGPNGTIFTLDATTGAQLDQFSIPEPFLTMPAIANGVIFGGVLGGNVYAYDLATHDELWRADSGVDALAPITVANDLVLVPGVGEGERGGVVALSATTGEKQWHFVPTEGLTMGAVAVADSLVYLSASDGTIHAIDLADGTSAWNEQYGDAGMGASPDFAARSSPVIADGALYVAGADGTLFATAGLQNELWQTRILAGIVSDPLVADGVLWVGTVDGTIYALGSLGNPIATAGTDAPASPIASPKPNEMLVAWTADFGGLLPLNAPQHVAADPEGNVYVVDPGNERIAVFGPDGTSLKEIGTFGSEPGQFHFREPGWAFGSVDIDADGAIYVSDTHTHRVQKLSSDGEFVLEWGSIGVGEGQFNLPGGILVANGQVYVADYGNNRIQSFTTDGEFVGSWGSFGSGEGQFRGPAGLAADSKGNIYVSEWLGGRVQVFTAEGEYLDLIGQPDDIGATSSIAIDGADNLVVGDYEKNRVLVYVAGGDVLVVYDNFDSGEQVFGPSGIEILPDGSVYIAEEGRNRIMKVQIPGVVGTADQD